MKVKDVMHPGGKLVAPDTPVAEVAAQIHEDHVLAVGEYDRLIGEVTESDIANADNPAKAESLTVRDVMSKPIVYCYPDEEVDDALRIMKKHDVRKLPVVSHQKRMIGYVDLGDITRH